MPCQCHEREFEGGGLPSSQPAVGWRLPPVFAHIFCSCCNNSGGNVHECALSLQALQTSPISASHKLQIGEKLTRGLGAGGNPSIGQVTYHATAVPM